MRNLEVINPEGMKPSRFISFGGGVSMVLALICLPLAYGAAPDVYFFDNPIVRLLILVFLASFMLSVFSVLFRWGWEIKYFGFSMIFIASVSLIAIIPLLSLLIYGTVSGWTKIGVLSIYLASHIWWGRKYLIIYRNVFSDEKLRVTIFEEESDAIYYNRDRDSYLLEKHYKFSQMPPNRYFIVFMLLAFMLVPMMGAVRKFTGLPFAHVFLIVSMLPISWMSIGLALRGFLICYFYPSRLRRATGKSVYVDLIRKPTFKKIKVSDVVRNKNL